MLFAKGFWQFYPYLRLALFFVSGILVANYFAFLSLALTATLTVLCIVSALIFIKRRYLSTLCIYLSVFFLGALLMMRSASELSQKNRTITGTEKEYKAIIISQPQPRGKTMAMDLFILQDRYKVKAHIFKDDALRAEQLKIGQGIVFTGVLERPENRGEKFNYIRWLNTHGFIATVFLLPEQWHAENLGISGISHFQKAGWRMLSFRQRLIDRISSHSNISPSTAILLALTLGDRTFLTQQQKTSFSDAGVAHLLALSGLHLSIVYGFLAFLMSAFRRRWLSTFFCVFTVWIYVMIVGLPVSAVRSAIMLSVYAVTSIGYRDRTGINVLALTAMTLLAFNPLLLWDCGFQLSFLSVLSIGIYFRPLYQIAHQWKPLLKKVWGFLVVSLAAQIGTTPLVLYTFGHMNPYVSLTSLFLIPLTMVILYVGFCGILLYAVGLNGALFVEIGEKASGFLMNITEWTTHLPGSNVCTENWSLSQTIITYLLIILLSLLLFKIREILIGGRVELK